MDVVIEINRKNTREFKKFFEANFSHLVLFADKYLRNPDLAADVAQECFIQLWHSQIEFTSIEKMQGFLYTVARNIALNHLKHKRVVGEWMVKNSSEELLFTRDNWIEHETYRFIYEDINQLAGKSRKIILYSLEGYSNQEIAEMMGVSINTIRTLKQNAYKKLRILLRGNLGLLFMLIYLKSKTF